MFCILRFVDGGVLFHPLHQEPYTNDIDQGGGPKSQCERADLGRQIGPQSAVHVLISSRSSQELPFRAVGRRLMHPKKRPPKRKPFGQTFVQTFSARFLLNLKGLGPTYSTYRSEQCLSNLLCLSGSVFEWFTFIVGWCPSPWVSWSKKPRKFPVP